MFAPTKTLASFDLLAQLLHQLLALERLGFERVWEGDLEAEDPADAGPAVVYVLSRPTDSSSQAR